MSFSVSIYYELHEMMVVDRDKMFLVLQLRRAYMNFFGHFSGQPAIYGMITLTDNLSHHE